MNYRDIRIHGLGPNVYSLRAARNRRPSTSAERCQQAADTHAARVRWVRWHAAALTKIALSGDRSADDLAEAARLGNDIQQLLGLFESEEG